MLFSPSSKADASAFREHELGKIQRFRQVHSGFLSFCKNMKQEPCQAEQYFLRRNFTVDRRVFARPYDANPDYFTNGDWILTQWLGNERYECFLNKEVKE